MALHIFEVNVSGDLIDLSKSHGDQQVYLTFNAIRALYELMPSFDETEHVVLVSDKEEEVKQFNTTVELYKNSETRSIHSKRGQMEFCRYKFRRYFPLGTKKLYIKIAKKENYVSSISK